MELTVLALEPSGDSPAPYSSSLMQGFQTRLLPRRALSDRRFLVQTLRDLRPDVVVVPGIVNPAALWACSKLDSNTGIVMAWDTPRRDTWRQRVGAWFLAPRLRCVDRMVVAGERSWQLVRQLGIPESRIRRGMYGVDWNGLAAAARNQLATEPSWPKAFGYVGRYVPEKGIEELAQAYALYRQQVSEPWPLITCGRGPLKRQLEESGATDLGFLQPPDIQSFLPRIGAFVLASRYEPWSLALVEAAAAARPLICTEACGPVVEVVRDYFNGRIVATRDPAALARAMRWVHEHYEQLPTMGHRSQSLASAYSAQMWADRWTALLEEVAHGHDRNRSSSATSAGLGRGARHLTFRRFVSTAARFGVARRATAPLLSRRRVQFLCFHDVPSDKLQEFQSLLRELAAVHQFVGYSAAVKMLRDGRIERPTISITFDDGLLTQFAAAEVVESFGATACFFVCASPLAFHATDAADATSFCRERLHCAATPLMGLDHIAQLRARGHEIGCHSFSHENLNRCDSADLQREIGDARDLLARRINAPIEHFAWPWGRFSRFSPAAAQRVFDSGFATCASAERGCHAASVTRARDLCIRRSPLAADAKPHEAIMELALSAATRGRGGWPRGWNVN